MIIKFKLEEYYDILDKYEELLMEMTDRLETEEQEGNALVVIGYRVVIPELHASFREGEWYTRNKEYNPNDKESEEYELQDSVYILYEENEKDVNKYLSFCTQSVCYILFDRCKQNKYPTDKLGDLECYIDTSEFDE